MPAALFTRGLARAAGGDLTGGEADVLSARKLQPTIDHVYAQYGLHSPGHPSNTPAVDDYADE